MEGCFRGRIDRTSGRTGSFSRAGGHEPNVQTSHNGEHLATHGGSFSVRQHRLRNRLHFVLNFGNLGFTRGRTEIIHQISVHSTHALRTVNENSQPAEGPSI